MSRNWGGGVFSDKKRINTALIQPPCCPSNPGAMQPTLEDKSIDYATSKS